MKTNNINNIEINQDKELQKMFNHLSKVFGYEKTLKFCSSFKSIHGFNFAQLLWYANERYWMKHKEEQQWKNKNK